ncbi:hypothetical protein F383_22935 [Gossypium arboreum]|uniref:Uncharacterized protein n=1 Tax=Gossypium arboreum TaxID=29729 RepID=A0A0B0NXH4_GOSAR|nr:hypothetical protein F383_22935 [Gossypium arboreum]
MNVRANYMLSEKVSTKLRHLKSPVRTLGIFRIHMS